MPDVLIYADTIRSPELRHELPLGIPDPFLYVERNGQRHVVLTSFEIARVLEIAGAPEPHAYEEFGYDDLIAKGLPRDEVLLEVAVNACGALGVTEALVPWTFPTNFADRLRAAGVDARPRSSTSSRTAAGSRARPSSPASGGRSAQPRRGWTRRARCCGAPSPTAPVWSWTASRSPPSGSSAAIVEVVHRARDGRRRVHRLARRAERGRARHGVRADRRGRAGRDRPLAERHRDGVLRGHDPDVRASASRPRRSCATTRSARRRSTGRWPRIRAGVAGRRRLHARLRALPRGRPADAALEATGRGARGRLLPRARARSRARGARGALTRPCARRDGRRRRRHASSRGSTGTATAASGSRISCSSPRTERRT